MLPISDDSKGQGLAMATLTFMTLFSGCFLLQLYLGGGQPAIPPNLGFIPGLMFGGASLPENIPVIPPPATMISYMFLHGGWMHLLGNLLYMWVFGPRLEHTIGPGRFTVLVIVSAVVAALAQAWTDPASAVPMVGASGGVSGILGAYLVFHPRTEISVIVPVVIVMRVVYLPAFVVLAAWFLLQLLYANLPSATGGGIAFSAHVGGFVAGLVLAPLLAPRLLGYARG
jgi:membrane associated rhomboid family serine protease